MKYTNEYKNHLISILKDIECGNQSTGLILLDDGYLLCQDPFTEIPMLYEHTNIPEPTLQDHIPFDRIDWIFVTDVLNYQNLDDVIMRAAKLCENSHRKLFIDYGNLGYIAYALAVFTGQGIGGCNRSRYTVAEMEKILMKYGFTLVKEFDLKKKFGEQKEEINQNKTLLNEYLLYAKQTVDSDSDISRMTRIYQKCENAIQQTDVKPFLSVIMRTQGKRRLELEEALLSLYGQTDDDFEILLLGHNLDVDGKAMVQEIIDETIQDLRKRIHLIEVNGGNRTTPLVRGFEAASGDYVAMLDDDDIVFDHWVETFHMLAKEHDGKILHTYCVRQDWLNIHNKYGGTGLRATGPFEKLYCRDFDELLQMSTNTCPIHSLAFPLESYRKYGIHFDEQLNVVEDWDFLMRTSFLSGVANAQEITSIYRIWRNAENSATIYGQNVWDDTRRYVIGKFDQNPIVFPKGSASRLVKIIEERNSKYMIAQNEPEIRKLWSFFADLGDEKIFTPERMRQQYVTVSQEGKFHVSFEELQDFGIIKRLRFDPSEEDFITLSDIEIELEYEDHKKKQLDIRSVESNGLRLGNRLFFLEADPQIIWSNPKEERIIRATLKGHILYDLDQETKHSIQTIVYDHYHSQNKFDIKKVFKR